MTSVEKLCKHYNIQYYLYVNMVQVSNMFCAANGLDKLKGIKKKKKPIITCT